PVEFQVVGKDRREPLSEMKEGFTQNVGKGGMGIFAKTLKEHDKEIFNFAPHETKLRLIINIPLDKEPIESYATVEWAERQPGPILDTYFFGVSYDFINEIEYDRIVNYTKWLRLKPRLIFLTIVTLGLAFILSTIFLFEVNSRKREKEKELLVSVAEGKLAEKAKTEAEENKLKAEAMLKEIENQQATLTANLKKVETERKALEKRAKLSEEDREHLQTALEEALEDKAVLERQAEEQSEEAQSESEATESVPAAGEDGITPERLKSEEGNYKKFKELILDGKIQPLSAYVSSHRGSIYHAAALFALAEIRYKQGDRSLAEANYINIVEIYPRSKYASYSSHRLEQIRRQLTYDAYGLQDLYNTYKLPELFDYRSIEPYYKP
ncbi:MAG: hypothetical protein Q8R48_03375, partial [Candidatus Omnitrophota bacterium]|nr:hypothetical protein [Candidatus Omnitrophota bacterium]